MVKALSVILCLLLLTSCGSPVNLPPDEENLQLTVENEVETELLPLEHLSGYSGDNALGYNVIDGGSCYYIAMNAYGNIVWHRLDKSSNELTPLCSNEKCSHDSKTCPAFVGSSTTYMLNDNKLYWVEQSNEYKLCCLDTETLERDELFKFFERDGISTWISEMFYDGKAFLSIQNYDTNNLTKMTSASYQLLDLKTLKLSEFPFAMPKERAVLQNKNKVYFFYFEQSENELEYSLHIYDFEINMLVSILENVRITLDTKSDLSHPISLLSCNDDFAYLKTFGNEVIKLDFASNTCTQVLNFDELGVVYDYNYSKDGTVGSAKYINGLFVTWVNLGDSFRIIAKDESGNVVYDYTVSESLLEGVKEMSLIGGDDDVLFITQSKQDSSEKLHYNAFIALGLKDGAIVSSKTITSKVQ